MDGVLIIDKPKGYTSRDIVNLVGKNYKTKKVGHTGTLDPLASGVLVVCINKGTKLVELLTALDKEYIAEFELGTLTDTLDSEGKVLKNEGCYFNEDDIKAALLKMVGDYEQVVPAYSAIKVNGKKLYEYARNNEKIELPKKKVSIYSLELLQVYYKNNQTYIKVKCHVSKGTYIRSLGNDIAALLNTNATMIDLRRIRQGKFDIANAITVKDLTCDTPIVSIEDVLSNIKKIKIDTHLYRFIENGREVNNIYGAREVLFLNEENKAMALYAGDDQTLKPYKMFFTK